ncbi:divalent-cation tolerance protein CutA [Methanobrevibacter filiformis]|nr:divalent-cation tolerance protein CutA [Methanobrevibacter filiformis]
MISLIYTTTSNKEEAESIGKTIVKERLGGCSNIINNIDSIYWWENNIEKDKETILLIKTLEENVEKVINRIKEIHSYENPCILAIPISNVSDSYLKWLKEEVEIKDK